MPWQIDEQAAAVRPLHAPVRSPVHRAAVSHNERANDTGQPTSHYHVSDVQLAYSRSGVVVCHVGGFTEYTYSDTSSSLLPMRWGGD